MSSIFCFFFNFKVNISNRFKKYLTITGIDTKVDIENPFRKGGWEIFGKITTDSNRLACLQPVDLTKRDRRMISFHPFYAIHFKKNADNATYFTRTIFFISEKLPACS